VSDWNPGSYAAFRDLRRRPALDLLARVPPLPPGDVVDLGCGAGAVAADLRRRFPDRRLVGVDSSEAMLAEACGSGIYNELHLADATVWQPQAPPALVFSNAALHWLPDHSSLMPRLARTLAPGGGLAVQMPRQQMAPSHRLLREIAAGMFPDRFDLAGWQPQVAAPATYHALLSPLGAVELWETEYLQGLAPVADGHPVRAFTGSTAMRPFLGPLEAGEAAAFTAAYDAALAGAYPPAADGSVLFPFRRLFLTLVRPG
jgi:trans-aconitate 2-methyltransferase